MSGRIVTLLLLLSGICSHGQGPPYSGQQDLLSCPRCLGPPDLVSTVQSAPTMSPELTLNAYHRRTALQARALASYDASTIVDAGLPDTGQQGRFELQTRYVAPATLRFIPLRFTGDRFVKSQVINRYLQAEVQHVEERDRSATAISASNYHFSYKRSESVTGKSWHVYTVKPRRKAPGLFKGEIMLDGTTGSLRRTKGAMVKSPSFFVRKIEFEQDYEDVNGVTVPVHLRCTARARLLGRVVIEVVMRDYALLALSDPPLFWPSVN